MDFLRWLRLNPELVGIVVACAVVYALLIFAFTLALG